MSGAASTILAPLANQANGDLLLVAGAAVAAAVVIVGVRKGWQLLTGMFDGAVGSYGDGMDAYNLAGSDEWDSDHAGYLAGEWDAMLDAAYEDNFERDYERHVNYSAYEDDEFPS